MGGSLAFLGSGRRTQRVRDTHHGAYALVSHRAQADNVIPDTCTITGTKKPVTPVLGSWVDTMRAGG